MAVGAGHVADQRAVLAAVILPEQRQVGGNRRALGVGGHQQGPGMGLHDLAADGLAALEVLRYVHGSLSLPDWGDVEWRGITMSNAARNREVFSWVRIFVLTLRPAKSAPISPRRRARPRAASWSSRRSSASTTTSGR